MTGLPRTLVIRTDVDDSEYQEAVREILFKRGTDLHLQSRTTYYYKEDNGGKLAKLEDLAKKLGVNAPWKVFNFMSPKSQKFLDNNPNYTSLTIDYDILPEGSGAVV